MASFCITVKGDWFSRLQHPKNNNQPTCYYSKAIGHFRFNYTKLVTASAITPSPKPPQKPFALLVWPNQDLEERRSSLVRLEGGKTLVVPEVPAAEEVQADAPVLPPVVASLSSASSDLDSDLGHHGSPCCLGRRAATRPRR